VQEKEGNMKTARYLIVLFLITFSSCKEETNPVTSQIDYGQLTRNWTNSYEEEDLNNSTKIFRPSNYKEYPSSRYREQLTFTNDSNCSYLVLDPADAHYFKSGKWSLIDREKNIIKIADSSGVEYKTLQIVELKKDLLKLVSIN
jgi:hypothetical protein